MWPPGSPSCLRGASPTCRKVRHNFTYDCCRYCTVLYYTVLYCTALHCTALHCNIFYYTEVFIPLYFSSEYSDLFQRLKLNFSVNHFTLQSLNGFVAVVSVVLLSVLQTSICLFVFGSVWALQELQSVRHQGEHQEGGEGRSGEVLPDFG